MTTKLNIISQNREKHDKEDITEDVVFEIELVKQVEVNIDSLTPEVTDVDVVWHEYVLRQMQCSAQADGFMWDICATSA